MTIILTRLKGLMQMEIDVSKLSRIYENSYLVLLNEIKDEKISF